MNAHSKDIRPLSVIRMDSGSPSGKPNRQHSNATERSGAAELSEDCGWRPATAAKAADCAAEMRRRIAEKLSKSDAAYRSPGDACLAAPILDRFLGDLPSQVLVSWVHFNPYTPTTSNLWYVEIPNSDEGLLTFFKEDPFQKQNAVFALISGTFNESVIAQAAVALFAANGHETCTIFHGLPTSISHRDNWRADTIAPWFCYRVVKALFRSAAASLWKNQNMPVLCDHLRRFPDPWERATAEIEYRRELAAGKRGAQAQFSEPAFDKWFELAADPVHVETERRSYGAACEVALRIHERWESEKKKGDSRND